MALTKIIFEGSHIQKSTDCNVPNFSMLLEVRIVAIPGRHTDLKEAREGLQGC